MRHAAADVSPFLQLPFNCLDSALLFSQVSSSLDRQSSSRHALSNLFQLYGEFFSLPHLMPSPPASLLLLFSLPSPPPFLVGRPPGGEVKEKRRRREAGGESIKGERGKNHRVTEKDLRVHAVN